MNTASKKVSIILGPTASGKTALAIDGALARHTAIISADSRQCYRELNIGVAKPSAAQLALVPHYFIDSFSIHNTINAARFEQLALGYAETLFNSHDELVMVGGTGLYIKAFCEGLDEIPEVDPEIRIAVQAEYASQGLEWLKAEVSKTDPEYFKSGEIENPQRLMRALEVKRSTGHSVMSFRKGGQKTRPFDIIKIGVDLPKEILHERINGRVDQMMQQGLLEEVKSLVPYRHLNALQTVGYTELFDFLDGKHSLDQAVDLIKRNTRQYAKRQMTWFKKDPQVSWLKPEEIEKIIKS